MAPARASAPAGAPLVEEGRVRTLIANVLEACAAALRGGVRPCPNCDSVQTRANPSSAVPRAWLCDWCGCRWRP
jgi:hypothetical protein